MTDALLSPDKSRFGWWPGCPNGAGREGWNDIAERHLARTAGEAFEEVFTEDSRKTPLPELWRKYYGLDAG